MSIRERGSGPSRPSRFTPPPPSEPPPISRPRLNALLAGRFGRRLTIVVASAGFGKSTLLANLALQDATAGIGFCLIDPHGDLFNEIYDGLSDGQRQRACIADVSATAVQAVDLREALMAIPGTLRTRVLY